MSANSFGSRFRINTFGESHGVALGVLIDGCPAGVDFDESLLKRELERRRPGVHAGQQQVVSARAEQDEAEILSGVFEGKTLGTPIAIIVRNQDSRSQDYATIRQAPRAGHADDVWRAKFGHSDYRGGGRSSGRETVARVMAGAVAQMLLRALHPDLQVRGYAAQIGPYTLTETERGQIWQKDVERYQARFPSERQNEIAALLTQARENGESHGGLAEIRVRGVPANLGQPVFHKLKSDLAQALMSVGAANGFELGAGMAAASAAGTKFHSGLAENYGGVRGGITTGEEILLRLSFKPTSSILDVAKKGRHDPCIVTRAIPVLEAMTWIVLADHALWMRTDRI